MLVLSLHYSDFREDLVRSQSILDSRTVVLRIGGGDLPHMSSTTIDLHQGMHSSGFGLIYYFYIACV